MGWLHSKKRTALNNVVRNRLEHCSQLSTVLFSIVTTVFVSLSNCRVSRVKSRGRG